MPAATPADSPSAPTTDTASLGKHITEFTKTSFIADASGAASTALRSIIDNFQANAFSLASLVLGLVVTYATDTSSSCLKLNERENVIDGILISLGCIIFAAVAFENEYGVTDGSFRKSRLSWRPEATRKVAAELNGSNTLNNFATAKLYARYHSFHMLPILFELFKMASNFFIAALSILFAVLDEEMLLRPGCNNETYDEPSTDAGRAAKLAEDDIRDMVMPFLWTAVATTLTRIILDILYEQFRNREQALVREVGLSFITKANFENMLPHDSVPTHYQRQAERLAKATALLEADPRALSSQPQTATGLAGIEILQTEPQALTELGQRAELTLMYLEYLKKTKDLKKTKGQQMPVGGVFSMAAESLGAQLAGGQGPLTADEEAQIKEALASALEKATQLLYTPDMLSKPVSEMVLQLAQALLIAAQRASQPKPPVVPSSPSRLVPVRAGTYRLEHDTVAHV